MPQNRFLLGYYIRKNIESQYSRNVIKKIPKVLIYCRKKINSQYQELFEEIHIDVRADSKFQHWIDENVYFVNLHTMPDSTSPAYRLILESSIKDLLQKNSMKSNSVEQNNYELLQIVESYIKRIINKLSEYSEKNIQKTRLYFERMLNTKAESLEEALQRILFWSSLFWQTGHTLIGLGRLDKILAPYIDGLSDEDINSLIKEFLTELHRYFAFKSGSLMGDTGQLIVLGGIENDGRYFCNRLTYDIIIALKNLKLPDPKILLRVSHQMPKDLLTLATECNATGIGCPLLSNDDIVISALEKFGYSHKDACNYITSACWEPFCYENSLGKLNLGSVDYAQVMEKCLNHKTLTKIKTFDELIDLYVRLLNELMKKKLERLNSIKWNKDPLMSLFTEGCVQSGKDISEGGAVHSDYGILTVGLANAINSLLNIKHYIFDKKEISIEVLKKAIDANYMGNESLRKRLQDQSWWGHDEPSVLELINRITSTVKDSCANFRNPFGGKIKIGFSSPSYMDAGQQTGALPDGRLAKQPLSVHISSKLGEPYTELINFAGKLDYSGIWSNGSVVDFFVSPSFIQSNFEKFCSFLHSAIKVGFFQMQMNVVSSKTLKDAKANPDLYPNLIVRVWGFSAYYKDLPEQYKDLLIQRAIESEMAA